MDYEQYKNVEKKIIEAAQNHSPEFDEKAWNKMEQLLDKDPKRKPLIWLWSSLLFLLLGTAGVILFTKKGNTVAERNTGENAMLLQNRTSNHVNVNSSDTTQPGAISTKENSEKTIGYLPLEPEPAAVLQNKNNSASINIYGSYSLSKKNKKAGTGIGESPVTDTENLYANKKIRDSQKAKMNLTITPAYTWQDIEKIYPGVEKNPINTSIREDKILKPVTTNSNNKQDSLENKFVAKAAPGDVSIISNAKRPGTKNRSTFSAKLFFLASVGAENANVAPFSFNNSKSRIKYGLGIGYQLNDRLSLQSGFFVARKIYKAGPKDYNAKPGSYFQTVQLLRVGANCLVYEIPIVISYKFIKHRKLSYYASTGVSSYLMKTENYHYEYLRNNTYKEYEMQYTRNTHLLSTLTLAAGIEKKLSDRFIMYLEPSISIPLKGVGEGGVKLYSTGLNLGIKYSPFKLK